MDIIWHKPKARPIVKQQIEYLDGLKRLQQQTPVWDVSKTLFVFGEMVETFETFPLENIVYMFHLHCASFVAT